jgi:hypothetical protein
MAVHEVRLSGAKSFLFLSQLGGTQALVDVLPSTKVTLLEQLASTSLLRFVLHCDLSEQVRKQYFPPSVCATQADPVGQSLFPVQLLRPQYPPLKLPRQFRVVPGDESRHLDAAFLHESSFEQDAPTPIELASVPSAPLQRPEPHEGAVSTKNRAIAAPENPVASIASFFFIFPLKSLLRHPGEFHASLR